MYDEIHYLRDKERGVVWEESIIMAPKSARFVFLSATIPNAREFAEWIAQTHHSPCHVVYTDYRPTPLQHYLFPSGAQGLYMVVDEKGMNSSACMHMFAKALSASLQAAELSSSKTCSARLCLRAATKTSLPCSIRVSNAAAAKSAALCPQLKSRNLQVPPCLAACALTLHCCHFHTDMG